MNNALETTVKFLELLPKYQRQYILSRTFTGRSKLEVVAKLIRDGMPRVDGQSAPKEE